MSVEVPQESPYKGYVLPDLEGKLVVVTGGSDGIGKELVNQATHAGAQVVFSYRDVNKAQAVTEQTNAKGFHLDLSQGPTIDNFVANLGLQGNIDYFIANAGQEFSGSLADHDHARLMNIIGVNAVGNIYLIRKLVLNDLMNPNGQIGIVGSVAADGNEGQLAYATAKAALRAVPGVMGYDPKVKEKGLGTKVIEPAFVRTPMAERMLRVLERRVIMPAKLDEFKERRYVMEPDYAAGEILKLTVNPAATGVITVPYGANLHDIRKKYFKS